MKTTKSSIGLRAATAVITVFVMFLVSCSDSNKIDYTSNDNANVQSEANSDAQTEETDDMAAVVLSSDNGPLSGSRSDGSSIGGRNISNINDQRFQCATVTLEFASDNVAASPGVAANPHGYITINFGAGCTGPGGRVRKGIIKIEFKGRRFLPGSTVITTFQDYYVDGVKIEGTRTLTNISANETAPVSFTIAEDGKVTWPDGTFATRVATRTRTWNRTTNPTGDSWTVTGSASGVNRKGREYTMTITKALVYKRECAITKKVFIAVEGTKELTCESKKVTIDYGSGDCDNKVTITINGRSKDVEASADGN
jgi:hypothetical protein